MFSELTNSKQIIKLYFLQMCEFLICLVNGILCNTYIFLILKYVLISFTYLLKVLNRYSLFLIFNKKNTRFVVLMKDI